jgi:type II secretory pathway pseudopilin PulG
LIEMIGVLAVIALLAVALIPQIIRRVDQAAATKEDADLNAMGDSLTQYILRNKRIPDYTEIASSIANDMSLPLVAVTNTPRRLARAFLTDQNFRVNGAALPYGPQTTNGSVGPPVSARMIFVSSLSRALPITSSASLSDAEFQAIWDTPEGAKPSTATWNGFGSRDDLHIKKLNLAPLFYQLILINHDTVAVGRFSIDGTTNSTLGVPAGGLGWNRYYLDGTVLGLHDTNSVVQTRYILKRNISYVFESDAWLGQLQSGQNNNAIADAFATEASEFFNSAWNTGAQQGAAQNSVLVAMYAYMFEYTLWATQCPHFSRHNASSPTQVPEYELLDDIGHVGSGGRLDEFSGTGGLLK